jgi:hypothetical protein
MSRKEVSLHIVDGICMEGEGFARSKVTALSQVGMSVIVTLHGATREE